MRSPAARNLLEHGVMEHSAKPAIQDSPQRLLDLLLASVTQYAGCGHAFEPTTMTRASRIML